VSCPIDAFLGDDDAAAIYENVAAWAEHTTSDFVIRAFPGGHHYINDNLAELVGDIEQRKSQLSAWLAERARATPQYADDGVKRGVIYGR